MLAERVDFEYNEVLLMFDDNFYNQKFGAQMGLYILYKHKIKIYINDPEFHQKYTRSNENELVTLLRNSIIIMHLLGLVQEALTSRRLSIP